MSESNADFTQHSVGAVAEFLIRKEINSLDQQAHRARNQAVKIADTLMPTQTKIMLGKIDQRYREYKVFDIDDKKLEETVASRIQEAEKSGDEFSSTYRVPEAMRTYIQQILDKVSPQQAVDISLAILNDATELMDNDQLISAIENIEEAASNIDEVSEDFKELINETRVSIEGPRYQVDLGCFSGFYETIHDDNIDRAIEDLFQDDTGAAHVPDNFHSVFTLTKSMQEAYCKEYVSSLKDYLATEKELDLPSIRFVETISPKFYNFETDRIIIDITENDLRKLEEMMLGEHRKAVEDTIKEKCTSHSGFASFYSNDIEDYLAKPVTEWDINEIGLMLEGVSGGWDDSDVLASQDTFQERVNDLVYEHLPEKARKAADAWGEIRHDNEQRLNP